MGRDGIENRNELDDSSIYGLARLPETQSRDHVSNDDVGRLECLPDSTAEPYSSDED